MEIVSNCPLSVASFVWRNASGAFARTLVCKATFLLRPGTSTLADAQEPLHARDVPWDRSPTSSPRAPSDLLPMRPSPDVTLTGHVFAPEGKHVRSLVARMQIGADLDKTILVFGERFAASDGRILEGAPFTKMPLRYELAAGGPDTGNPVGMRFDAPADAFGRVPIPYLQPPWRTLARAGDRFEPIGFGPIAPTWPMRAGKLHAHAASFRPDAWFEAPLPPIDPAYFQAAPPDQLVKLLRTDERIALENLHPAHARLVTALPGIRPRAAVDRPGLSREEIPLVCDTLWIDADRSLAALAFRGTIALRHASDPGRISLWTEGGSASAAAPVPGAPRRASEHEIVTTLAPSDKLAETLPFTSGPPSPSFAAAPSVPDKPVSSPLPPDDEDDGIRTTLPIGARPPRADVLPFHHAQETNATPPRPPSAPPPPIRPPSAPPPPIAEAPPPPIETPPPPPMIGPLAGLVAPNPADKQEPAPEPAPAPAQATTETNVTPEPAVPDIDLETCASIAASTGRPGAERARILEQHGLDASSWARVEERYDEAIEGETHKGKTALLRRYDEAYVARLEAERGPITPEDYARITVALERGEEAEALSDLGLPRDAAPRIDRVWLRKRATDPIFDAEIRRAIGAARAA